MNPLQYDTPWRRMTAAIFERPRDGKVFGAYDIDVTDLMAWIDARRAEGHRVTAMHLVVAAIGRGFADIPEFNCFARWGRVIHRGDVTVSMTVSVDGRDMGVVKVRNADQKGAIEICEEVWAQVEKTRSSGGGKGKGSFLPRVPWPFRKWIYNAVRWLVHEGGVSMPGVGLAEDSFGSVLVTNVGSLGLAYAFPALMPASNLSTVVAMGKVVERPAVLDGQIVIRKFMPFGATFDHRVVDGAHIGKLVTRVNHYLAHPEVLGSAPQGHASSTE